jgi:hypothetical protein
MNQSKVYNNESKIDIGILLPSGYIEKGKPNFKAFIEEFLLSMHNEAEKIIIYLAPIVFNVNLDLHILEGTAIVDKKDLVYFKQTFPCLMGDQKMNNFSTTISLFYRFSHYDKFYTHQFISEHGNNMTYSSFDKVENRQRITVLATDMKCEVCNRVSELLTFTHMPGLPLCKQCLIDLINKIIANRVKSYTKESYNNKECKKFLFII